MKHPHIGEIAGQLPFSYISVSFRGSSDRLPLATQAVSVTHDGAPGCADAASGRDTSVPRLVCTAPL
jgi:hypothetical protein